MPKVNLLPKEELDTKPLGRFLKWALSYGRYIIISVELVVFLVFFSRFIYDRQLADLNDEIEQKQAIIASAQEFEEEFKSTQNLISYIETLDENRQIYLDVLSILENVTPIQVVYSSVRFGENTLTLEAEASSNESFAQFLAQIKTVEEFASITLDSLSKDEDNQSIITFTTTIVLKIDSQDDTKELEENGDNNQ